MGISKKVVPRLKCSQKPFQYSSPADTGNAAVADAVHASSPGANTELKKPPLRCKHSRGWVSEHLHMPTTTYSPNCSVSGTANYSVFY